MVWLLNKTTNSVGLWLDSGISAEYVLVESTKGQEYWRTDECVSIL